MSRGAVEREIFLRQSLPGAQLLFLHGDPPQRPTQGRKFARNEYFILSHVIRGSRVVDSHARFIDKQLIRKRLHLIGC